MTVCEIKPDLLFSTLMSVMVFFPLYRKDLPTVVNFFPTSRIIITLYCIHYNFLEIQFKVTYVLFDFNMHLIKVYSFETV